MAEKDPVEEKKQELSFELRRSLNNAYAFVEGQKSAQSFAALTIEDLLDQQIESIEGKDTQARPNQLNRIMKTVNDVVAAAEKIKSMPDDAFNEHDEKLDVNTPPDVAKDGDVL
jgi:hypothetical protein